MLIRNIVELLLVATFAIIGIVIYIYGNKKLKDVESDLHIRCKQDLPENTIEDVASIQEEYIES